MAELAAVVGIGQTRYATKRGDVSIAGLVREAAQNASMTPVSVSTISMRWSSARRRICSRA
jgi:hypothetical protein